MSILTDNSIFKFTLMFVDFGRVAVRANSNLPEMIKRDLYIASNQVEHGARSGGIKSEIEAVLASRKNVLLSVVNMYAKRNKSDSSNKNAALKIKIGYPIELLESALFFSVINSSRC